MVQKWLRLSKTRPSRSQNPGDRASNFSFQVISETDCGSSWPPQGLATSVYENCGVCGCFCRYTLLLCPVCNTYIHTHTGLTQVWIFSQFNTSTFMVSLKIINGKWPHHFLISLLLFSRVRIKNAFENILLWYNSANILEHGWIVFKLWELVQKVRASKWITEVNLMVLRQGLPTSAQDR